MGWPSAWICFWFKLNNPASGEWRTFCYGPAKQCFFLETLALSVFSSSEKKKDTGRGSERNRGGGANMSAMSQRWLRQRLPVYFCGNVTATIYVLRICFTVNMHFAKPTWRTIRGRVMSGPELNLFSLRIGKHIDTWGTYSNSRSPHQVWKPTLHLCAASKEGKKFIQRGSPKQTETPLPKVRGGGRWQLLPVLSSDKNGQSRTTRPTDR